MPRPNVSPEEMSLHILTGDETPSQNLGPYIDGVSWPLVAVAGLFLGARLIIKRRMKGGLYWDDLLLAASWIMLVLYATINSYLVTVGFGKHDLDRTTSADHRHIVRVMLWITIGQIPSLVGVAWSKTAFAVTLLRITTGKMRYVTSVRYVLWAIIITLNLVTGVNVVLEFVRCTPVESVWNPFIGGYCWHPAVITGYTTFSAAFSAAMDFVLACIPWVLIWSFQMRLKEKIGVGVCMSLGVVAGLTSIVRSTKVPLNQDPDFTYDSGYLTIWIVAEIATTIIATSIPTLRALISKVVNSKRSYRQSGFNGEFAGARGMMHLAVISSPARQTIVPLFSSKNTSESGDADMGSGRADDLENGRGGIMRTATIRVDYDPKSMAISDKELEAGGFELDDLATHGRPIPSASAKELGQHLSTRFSPSTE